MHRRTFVRGVGIATLGACIRRDASPRQVATPRGEPAWDPWREALDGARQRAIARIRDYRTAATFPRNHRIFGHAPTFIDDQGRPCAVAYLMQRSGYGELARTIARTDNHVYIERIEEPRAIEWIRFSGLTKAECAFIQPRYPKRPYRGLILDRDRLLDHFIAVEQQLERDREASLDIALEQLAPLIEAGASIARVVH
jgi:hypothetical protein